MAEQQNRGNKRLFEAFGGGGGNGGSSDTEDYVQTAADCGKSDINSANSDIAAVDNSDVEHDDIDIENNDTIMDANNKDQTSIEEDVNDGSNGMGGRKRKCLNPTRISNNGDGGNNKDGDNHEDGNFSSDDNDEGNFDKLFDR